MRDRFVAFICRSVRSRAPPMPIPGFYVWFAWETRERRSSLAFTFCSNFFTGSFVTSVFLQYARLRFDFCCHSIIWTVSRGNPRHFCFCRNLRIPLSMKIKGVFPCFVGFYFHFFSTQLVPFHSSIAFFFIFFWPTFGSPMRQTATTPRIFIFASSSLFFCSFFLRFVKRKKKFVDFLFITRNRTEVWKILGKQSQPKLLAPQRFYGCNFAKHSPIYIEQFLEPPWLRTSVGNSWKRLF